MATHKAVVTAKPRTPLELIDRPTKTPGPGEVRVRSEWTSSTPVDLHQADGGAIIASWPHVLGDNTAGTVVEVGGGVTHLAAGDKVLGFVYRSNDERPYQTYITTDAFMFGKVPPNLTMQQAATVPDNLVTAFHSINTELGLTLPWPKPKDEKHPAADKPFLVWGGSGSAGQYAIQVLKYYGFTNIIATASKRHHETLRKLGATQVFDYNDADVVEQIHKAAGSATIPYILDCIGSFYGSVTPITKIAKAGTHAAILLPVIVKDASTESAPEYAMGVEDGLDWAKGVKVTGVRTHFYLDDERYKKILQPEIVPAVLADGSITPNKYKLIEGDTMLVRAQRALDGLRKKEASGERFVWQVADEQA